MKNIFNNFLICFINGNLNPVKQYFNDNSEINYSTVGYHKGLDNIIKAITVDDDFKIKSNVVTNLLEYDNNDESIIIANVSHLWAQEAKNQLFSLVIGGKYKFILNKSSNIIKNIDFDLEYEFENTYLAKSKWNWRMYQETYKNKIISPVIGFSEEIQTDEEAIKKCVYKLLLALDLNDLEYGRNYFSKNTQFIFEHKTEVNHTRIINQMPLEDYFVKNKIMIAQNHHSIKINEVKIDGNNGEVISQRYNPSKTENKHLDITTAYKLFFNEIIKFNFVKSNNKWLVNKISKYPKVEVTTVGYDLLEL